MKGEIQLILGPMFSGKCLGEGTLVLQASGKLVPVEAVAAGDKLLGEDLRPTIVLSTTMGMGPLYRVTQSNGASYVVNQSHILTLRSRSTATRPVDSASPSLSTDRSFGLSVSAVVDLYDGLPRSETIDLPLMEYLRICDQRKDLVGYSVTPEIFDGLTEDQRWEEMAEASGERRRLLAWSLGLEPDEVPSPALRYRSAPKFAEQELSVTPAGSGRYFGFVLSRPRFVLGCCAVTHNTTELVRRVKRYEVARKKCAIVKHAKDVRYTKKNAVATHDAQIHASLAKTNLMPSFVELLRYDVVGIDEGQFFDDIAEFAEAAANAGKIVVIAALDGDFDRRPFGGTVKLVPMAESIVKLNAICMFCQKDAAFSLRTTPSKEIILIGGSECYSPACRKCYFEHRDLGSSGR